MKVVISALTDQNLKARKRLISAQISIDSTNLTFLFTTKFMQIHAALFELRTFLDSTFSDFKQEVCSAFSRFA
jgi:hypothetical protein